MMYGYSESGWEDCGSSGMVGPGVEGEVPVGSPGARVEMVAVHWRLGGGGLLIGKGSCEEIMTTV